MYECILLRKGALKGVFSNLRRKRTSTRTSPYGTTFIFISSHFLKRNISMETWEHIKLGELPKHNAPTRVLLFGGGGGNPSK
jgi:hypothetical protein